MKPIDRHVQLVGRRRDGAHDVAVLVHAHVGEPEAVNSLTRMRRSVSCPGVLGQDVEPSSERVLMTA